MNERMTPPNKVGGSHPTWYYKARDTILARLQDLVEEHRMASVLRDKREEESIKREIRVGRRELDLLEVLKSWDDSSPPCSGCASRHLDTEVDSSEDSYRERGPGCTDSGIRSCKEVDPV